MACTLVDHPILVAYSWRILLLTCLVALVFTLIGQLPADGSNAPRVR